MELNVFVELLDGSRKQIGGMTLFSWVCSADTPADSLKVRCLQQMEAEVVRIEVQSGAQLREHTRALYADLFEVQSQYYREENEA